MGKYANSINCSPARKDMGEERRRGRSQQLLVLPQLIPCLHLCLPLSLSHSVNRLVSVCLETLTSHLANCCWLCSKTNFLWPTLRTSPMVATYFALSLCWWHASGEIILRSCIFTASRIMSSKQADSTAQDNGDCQPTKGTKGLCHRLLLFMSTVINAPFNYGHISTKRYRSRLKP